MKKRISIPESTKRELYIECGYKCSMNRCEREIGLEIHHIDSDPSNNNIENLIVLCSTHHHLADIKKIDKKTCQFLKKSLSNSEQIFGKTSEIQSRREYFSEMIKCLKSNNELRATFVGPTFIRPEFLKANRNAIRATPDLDDAFFNFINKNPSRVIFRNSVRFKNKILEYIKFPEQKDLYINQMLEKINEMEFDDRFSNFQFCFIDSGFVRIDYIFEDQLISCHRTSPISPVERGTIYFDKNEINRAKRIFDNIFEKTYRGKKNEYQILRDFVSTLFND